MLSSVTTFVHEQTIASDTWTISHNLGVRAPIVDTWITFEGNVVKIMPLSVVFTNVNTCVVLFNSPQIGTAVVA